MPPFGPINRRDLIRALHKAGFEGPHTGGRQQYMVRPNHRLLPNPRAGDISRDFLTRILKHSRITKAQWEAQ